MSYKELFFYFSYGGRSVHRSGTICAIVVEGNVRDICMKLLMGYWRKVNFGL